MSEILPLGVVLTFPVVNVPLVVIVPLRVFRVMPPEAVVRIPTVILPALVPEVLPLMVIAPVPWVTISRLLPSALVVRSIPPALALFWVSRVRLLLFCRVMSLLPKVPLVVIESVARRIISAFKPSISDSKTVVGEASAKSMVPAVAPPLKVAVPSAAPSPVPPVIS